jgi:hypothetical protein
MLATLSRQEVARCLMGMGGNNLQSDLKVYFAPKCGDIIPVCVWRHTFTDVTAFNETPHTSWFAQLMVPTFCIYGQENVAIQPCVAKSRQELDRRRFKDCWHGHSLSLNRREDKLLLHRAMFCTTLRISALCNATNIWNSFSVSLFTI